MRSAIPGGMAIASIREAHARLRTDMAGAASDFATELLRQRSVSQETARAALDRLRRRVHAAQAAVWIVTETDATCLVQVGGAATEVATRIVDLADRAIVIERLRHHGALRCRSGEIAGVEELVPRRVRSFVVATGPSPDSSFAVLVMGWKTPEPPCDDTAVAHLRTAVGLLHRVLTDRHHDQQTLPDAILGSLDDRIVVVDSHGTIIAVNAAWNAFSRLQGDEFARIAGVGANYFAIWRRAALKGSPDVRPVLRGVQAVADGNSYFFQTAYPCHDSGEERWYTVTATQLNGQSGGAVVAHTVVTPEKVTGLARDFGERLFHRLVDTIPVPICIVGSDGGFIHGNERWIELTQVHGRQAAENRAWIDMFHPDDRPQADAGFRAAVASRSAFNLELRVQASDGTSRWSTCVGAPHLAADGELQGYVIFCYDLSAKRDESALSDLTSKLISAQEAERSRIGRELHDDLGQQAAVLAAKLDALARNPRLPRTLLRAGVIEAGDNLQELAAAIHSLSHELHPAKLKLLGLVNSLEALVRDVSRESNVDISFAARDIPADIPEPIALCVFRVAQEALQNAVKHSGTDRIAVQVTATTSQLTLRVSDKGRGFDLLKHHAAGIGLLTMRERVELSGGRLKIDTTPAHGTNIEATLPLSNGLTT